MRSCPGRTFEAQRTKVWNDSISLTSGNKTNSLVWLAHGQVLGHADTNYRMLGTYKFGLHDTTSRLTAYIFEEILSLYLAILGDHRKISASAFSCPNLFLVLLRYFFVLLYSNEQQVSAQSKVSNSSSDISFLCDSCRRYHSDCDCYYTQEKQHGS